MKTPEQILNQNLWGCNKEKLNLHWDFKRQIVNAMVEYAEELKNKRNDLQ